MIIDTTNAKPLDCRITIANYIPGGIGPASGIFFNQIVIDETNVGQGTNQCAGLSVDHFVKGPLSNGSRLATISKITVLADAVGGSVNDGMYVGHAAQATGAVKVMHHQSLYGANYYGIVNIGCTGYHNVTGCELNTIVAEPVAHKTGLQIVSQTGDTARGTVTDAAITVGACVGGAGYTDGLLFSDFNGSAPIPAHGTLIRAAGERTVNNGIDLLSYTFTGNVFQSKNFTLAGDGSFSARGRCHALNSTESIALTSPLVVLDGDVYLKVNGAFKKIIVGADGVLRV